VQLGLKILVANPVAIDLKTPKYKKDLVGFKFKSQNIKGAKLELNSNCKSMRHI
jgi:hypothetical protein